jgi:hypothetical protein
LAASDPELDFESTNDCMVWGVDARLNADVLSPSITMRFPITDFVSKQQSSNTEIEQSNLRNNLRRFLGATPKKDASTSRPHPILHSTSTSRPHPILHSTTQNLLTETQPSHSDATSPSTPQQSTADESLERRKQIRRVWLGSMGQHLAGTMRHAGADVLPATLGESRDQFQMSAQPSKVLRASDFDAAFSSIISAGAGSSADGSIGLKATSGILSPSAQTNVKVSSPALAAATPKDAGEFFLRAKEYLRTRHIVPSQVQNAPTVESNGKKFIDVTASGARDASILDDSVITWGYVSHAWGAKPKRGDDSKLQPKSN